MSKLKELNEILLKDEKDLSEEEIKSLKENEGILSDEDKAKFAGVFEAKEKDEDLDEKTLEKLIAESIGEKVNEKFKGLDDMVKKFYDGVKEQREKALQGIDNGKKVDSDKIVLRFFKALTNKDRGELKSIEKEQKMVHKALNSDTDEDGGYLLPEELVREVLRIAEDEYGVARSEFFNLPFGVAGDTRRIPTLASGVSAFWTKSGAKKKSTTPKFGLVKQTLNKLTAIVPWVDEFAEDSAINITSLIATLIAEAIAKEEDLAFFIGDGTETYGEFTGILNNADVASLELASGVGFTDMTADDLELMQYEVPSNIAKTGKYFMHRSILGIVKRLKDDNGDYIYQKPADSTKPATLWEKPIVLVEAMPDKSESGANKPFVIFSDLKKVAIFSEKGTLRVKLLDQATITDTDGQTTINLAEQDMSALRFVGRKTYTLALPKGVCVLKTKSSS